MVKKLFVVIALALAASVALGYFGRESTSVAQLALGPNVGGKIAYVRSGAIWLYERGQSRQLTRGPQDAQDKRDASPSFSPDGTEIVYVRFDEGFSDLYRLDLSNPRDPIGLTDNRPLLETGAEGYNLQALWALQPAWSPNGARIAFTTDLNTWYPGLASMDPDGDNIRRLEFLNHDVQGVEHPSYSPDGDKIALANYVTNNGKGQIWVLNLETGVWTEVTNSKEGAYDPAWSPDGKWIAFAMRSQGASNIYVVPTDAQQWEDEYPTPIQVTIDGTSRSPAWSPDGSRLAYLSLGDGSFDLYAGEVVSFADGSFELDSVQKLTDKAHIDAPSGLSWGR